MTLPALANTDDSDRALLREISDDDLFGTPEPVSETVPEGEAASLETSGAATPSDRALPAVQDMTASQEPEPADPWSRIRASMRFPTIENDIVNGYRDQYIEEAMWVGRILERGRPYIEHLVNELDDRFMPVELALLPAIESGFRPNVHSRGQAAGLWQIVPITATEIGIERTTWFDGRSDLLVSTTAAIDYLSYLSAEFNADWELILAAYNAGPGRIRRAVRKNLAADKPGDFWSLELPEETRAYVPKMLALVNLVKMEPSPLPLPDLTDSDGFELVDVGRRISVDKAAEISGLDLEQLSLLNSGLIHGVTAPDGPHRLYLPAGQTARFLERIESADQQALFSLPRTHEVVAGDTLSDIALAYGMTQRHLMEMNGMNDTDIRVGQELAVLDTLVDVEAIEYVVTVGDNLTSIARRHSVPVNRIVGADGEPVRGNLIHPGETLRIIVSDKSNG